ncbi:MAG: FAS1-like dehydratase domain-containing protein [Acidimicrobiia bacterium]
MARTELLGRDLGTETITIESAPVRAFARALHDTSATYSSAAAPIPPTFPFAFPYWGTRAHGGAGGFPMHELRGPGRLTLHGEQRFTFAQWPHVGDALTGHSHVVDVYERPRRDGGVLEFYVVATEWTNTHTGAVMVYEESTFIISVDPDATTSAH